MIDSPEPCRQPHPTKLKDYKLPRIYNKNAPMPRLYPHDPDQDRPVKLFPVPPEKKEASMVAKLIPRRDPDAVVKGMVPRGVPAKAQAVTVPLEPEPKMMEAT